MAKKKNSSGTGRAVFGLVLTVAVIWGGIASCLNHDTTQPSTPADYSTILPTYNPLPETDSTDTTVTAPTTSQTPDTPVATSNVAGDGSTGGDGGSDLDLPGHGYVDGPGVHCGLSGCHIHVLPHFGFHF